MRVVHEAQMHERSSFVTLTYSDDWIPKDWSLNIRHWQLFAKKLRHRVGKFRYFMCGEYGDKSSRPHYHAIIFGHDFIDKLTEALPPSGKSALWTHPTLQAAWSEDQAKGSRGMVAAGAMSMGSAAYVAGYVMKKAVNPRSRQSYAPRLPEFVSMSRRPGLGASWFETYRSDVFPSDLVRLDGKKFRPPRYYDNKLSESERAELQERRRAALRSEDLTLDRLLTREEIALAQVQQREW